MAYRQNYDEAAYLDAETVLIKLRASLKRRGAEGIRGLARHFKASVCNCTCLAHHHACIAFPATSAPPNLRVCLQPPLSSACLHHLPRFRQICDMNRNGSLDADEFEKCCRLNNLGLSSQDMALLHKHFDRDRSGSVGYEEFLRAVRGRLPPVRKQVVKKIFDVLDKCVQQHRPQPPT